MRAAMNTYCFAVGNPVLNPDVRALLSYDGSTALPTDSVDWGAALELVCQDLNDTLLVPVESEPAPPSTVIFALTLSFQIGAYQLDRAFVNGTSWRSSSVPTLNEAVTFLSTAGASNTSYPFDSGTNQVLSPPVPSSQSTNVIVDVLLTNFDDGAHPFHLHGHKFWILASSPTGYFPWPTYPEYNVTDGLPGKMMRDTVTIEAYGWILLRFRADNPGLWAMHCHIIWHMEAGMLVQFWGRKDIMATWRGLPQDVLGLCDA
jgi:Multicopper oxidase